MLRTWKVLLYWIPVIVWMGLIYLASSDTHSAEHSSSIVHPIINWFFPGITPLSLAKVDLIARKIAHLFVYAVLASLLWFAFVGTFEPAAGRWSWRPVLWILGLIVLYASLDEIHQQFVPTRQGTHWDVIVDTTGASIGLACTWAGGKWRRKW